MTDHPAGKLKAFKAAGAWGSSRVADLTIGKAPGKFVEKDEGVISY